MYIYPFNTLVEQTKQTLQKLFPDKDLQKQIVVVNSLTPIAEEQENTDDSEKYYQKSLLDSSVFGLSIYSVDTRVSFFNLLFGSRKEDIFGFFSAVTGDYRFG